MTPSETARAWRDNSTAKACQSGKIGTAITCPILLAQSRVKKKVNVRVLNVMQLENIHAVCHKAAFDNTKFESKIIVD